VRRIVLDVLPSRSGSGPRRTWFDGLRSQPWLAQPLSGDEKLATREKIGRTPLTVRQCEPPSVVEVNV
jgi:hypothetical protein